jgi:hypothetical protein
MKRAGGAGEEAGELVAKKDRFDEYCSVRLGVVRCSYSTVQPCFRRIFYG